MHRLTIVKRNMYITCYKKLPLKTNHDKKIETPLEIYTKN